MYWRLNNISCTIDDRILLKDLSIELHLEKPLAIVGSSGAGKSIGIQCALGLFPFQKGNITFEQQTEKLELCETSTAKDWASLRQQIMLVPQFPTLFDDFSVKANLLFPFRARAKARAMANSDLFKQVVHRLGLTPIIDSNAEALTPGQRKQVAIARAMLLQPKVLVLDEPTADLDPTAKTQMIEVLQSLFDSQTALIMITHDVHLLQTLKTHLKVIHKGQLNWEGDWSEREQAPENVQKMLGLTF